MAVAEEDRVKVPEMVCEFLDIFPEDLPGLSPVREIKFSIKVLPGTASISKAPYHMTLIERAKLKKQN